MSYYKDNKNNPILINEDFINLDLGLIKITETEFNLLSDSLNIKHTNEELISQAVKHIETAIQSHMDITAQSKGYDSILSAVSYAGEVNPFQEEAKQFLKWRGAVWDYAYNQINAYTIETMPTIDEFIITLPKLEDY